MTQIQHQPTWQTHPPAALHQNMEELDQYLASRIAEVETTIAKTIAQHILSAPGKRMRPQLFFRLCHMLNYDGPHHMTLAAAAECVHMASLLHDDVIDNSPIRRNLKTPQTIWGDQSAILMGDVVYAMASQLMVESGSLDVVACFSLAIQQMSEGELLQLENAFQVHHGESAYMEIISRKTGALIAALCQSAGILAGVNPNRQKALHRFGSLLGQAFQIVDDTLDIHQTSKVLGKKNLNDIASGKMTLPLLTAFQRATPKERQELHEAFQELPLSSEQIQSAVRLISTYRGIETSLERAKTLTKEATSTLIEAFPPSHSLDELVNYTHQLLERSL